VIVGLVGRLFRAAASLLGRTGHAQLDAVGAELVRLEARRRQAAAVTSR
jgi:hypothetical protein